MQYQDDPPRFTTAGTLITQASWALIENGRVMAVVNTNNHSAHPFGDDVPRAIPGSVPLCGRCALRVTGTIAHTGFLVDRMGNVTPCEGRDGPLKEGESAMRAGPGAAIPHVEHVSPVDEEPSDNGEGDHGETEHDEAE